RPAWPTAGSTRCRTSSSIRCWPRATAGAACRARAATWPCCARRWTSTGWSPRSARFPRWASTPRPSCVNSAAPTRTSTRCAPPTPCERTPMLSQEEQAIVDTVRDWVDREVKPVVRELEHTNTYPAELIDQMKQMGIFGLMVPEPYGEVAVSTPCYVAVTEQLARGWMSLAGAMGGHSVGAKLIARYGTEEQTQRYLPRMATGELRATMALTEPGGGSDLQAMKTVARKDGDHYVINGAKTWITNSRRSGLIALLCKTDPNAEPRYRGISILLVEHGPGLTVSRDLPKLGYKGVESCELHFDDYRTPLDSVLGGVEGKGFSQMMNGLEAGRIQVASRALGVARAALDDAMRYAQERETFGKP